MAAGHDEYALAVSHYDRPLRMEVSEGSGSVSDYDSDLCADEQIEYRETADATEGEKQDISMGDEGGGP